MSRTRGGQTIPEYKVWQLTDGTVVLQGAVDPTSQIKEGKFAWFSAVGTRVTVRLAQKVRHQLYKVLEQI